MSQDEIHISNVVGPVNIKARLERVSQVVNNAPALENNQKEQLVRLLDELKNALEPVAKSQPDDADRVIKSAEVIATEVAKQKPSKSYLDISAAGLKEAAKAVAEIAPTVITVANQIVHFIAATI